jgi:hypothetical protein
MNPDLRGKMTEGMILSELLKRGISVLVPYGYSQRYDLAVDIDGKIYKLQCKTGRIRNGAVQFSTCSMNNVTHERRDYRGQVDFLAVLEPTTNKVYLVEPEDIGVSEGFLRFELPISGQVNLINLAEDFDLDVVLKRLRESDSGNLRGLEPRDQSSILCSLTTN